MIGMNIRVLRKRNKMSQEVVAEKLNVSRQTVAK
ncbi:helix-turn-helix transcriptional regulator [Metabacillus litoralis]|nr:helix-turn-helix transcriptional regulator [Metabacillus litoralis]